MKKGLEPFVWDYGAPGRVGAVLPEADVPFVELPPGIPPRKDLPLPEVSELDVVRHFTRLLKACTEPNSQTWLSSSAMRHMAGAAHDGVASPNVSSNAIKARLNAAFMALPFGQWVQGVLRSARKLSE